MSIAALNFQFAQLIALAKATPAALQHTTDILADSGDAHGGDTVVDPRHGDTPSPKKPSVGIALRGLFAHSDVGKEVKRIIDQHVDGATKKVDEAVADSLQELLAGLDKRSKLDRELFNFLATRESAGVTGLAAIESLLNDFKALQAAQKRDDTRSVFAIRDTMTKLVQFINTYLLGAGRGNPKDFILDLDRLLSEFGRTPSTTTQKSSSSSLSSATSTGNAP
jgi:hypothetical protein